MNESDLRKYVMYLAKREGFPDDELSDFVNTVIDLGGRAFWDARPWSFRHRPYTMTTGSATATALPTDFCGFRSVQERTSNPGWDLEYYIKEEFDCINPDRQLYGTGNPRIFTTYFDQDKDQWYALFAPTPVSGTSIYWDILTKYQGVQAIPDGDYSLGLLAAIGYLMYPIGSPQRLSAYSEFKRILTDIEPHDSPFKGRLFRWKTESDEYVDTGWPWV